MIPKTIHFCWFGGKPKTRLAARCIASWRRTCPGWEIREWDEASFPVADFRFASEAARAARWAVVSDVARYWCLERFGGVYFDTDVELLAPVDDLLDGDGFIAREHAPHAPDRETLNPGGGIALNAGSAFARTMLARFRDLPFDASAEVMPFLHGLFAEALAASSSSGERPRQVPAAWFSPIRPDGRVARTAETRAIHWYAMNGYPLRTRFARWLAWHRMGWLLGGLRRLRRGR